jgi:hypothetical protein
LFPFFVKYLLTQQIKAGNNKLTVFGQNYKCV